MCIRFSSIVSSDKDVVIGVGFFYDFKVDQLFWKRQGFTKDTNA